MRGPLFQKWRRHYFSLFVFFLLFLPFQLAKAQSPSGSLNTSGTCSLPGPISANRCTDTLVGTKNNIKYACIWLLNPTQLHSCHEEASWSVEYGWTTDVPRVLELRGHSSFPSSGSDGIRATGTYLAQKTVVAAKPAGTLTSNSPCMLSGSSDTERCSVNLTGTKSNIPVACVWFVNPAKLFSCHHEASWVVANPWAVATSNIVELRGHLAWPSGSESDYRSSTYLSQTSIYGRLASTIPGTPTRMTETYDRPSNSFILNWTAVDGATEYQLMSGGLELYRGANASYVFGPLSPGQTYSFTVRACNSSGCSGARGRVAIAPAPPPDTIPAQPSRLTETYDRASNTFILNWTPVDGANEYQFMTGTLVAYRGLNTSYTFGPLSPGQTYSFSVKACNSAGCSPARGRVAIAPAPAPDPEPGITSRRVVFIHTDHLGSVAAETTQQGNANE